MKNTPESTCAQSLWWRRLGAGLALAMPAGLQAAESAGPKVRGFGIPDWLILVSYAAALIGIGMFYSRRQTSSEEYFVGSRRVSPFLVGISLYATLFSTLSYLGLPGELIQNGPVLVCVTLAAYPFVYFIVGYGIIPLIVRLPVTSAYELLETRLGRPIRLLGSGIFVMTRLVWMAVMLFATSTVLVVVMGWDPRWVTPISILTGAITTVYTLTGGIKAVLVTDVLQFFVLLAGALFTLVYITYWMGGVGAWWPTEWTAHWAPQPVFSLDPGVRVTVFGTFFGSVIWWICTSASDQMAIQRYLSTRDKYAARRAFLHSCAGGAAVTVILILVGLALLGFHRDNPALFPSTVSLSAKGDAVFPYFVSHFLPSGLPGLVMAGLLAAAMSSLSSGINSAITVISKDFIEIFVPNDRRTEKDRVGTARILGGIIGLVAIGGSQLASVIPGNLIEVAGKSINLLVCPLFGLFFLALFVKFATPFGAWMGATYSAAAAVLVGYWELITGRALVSFQWIAPIALVTTIVCSCLFSLLPTRGKPPAVLAIYAGVVLLPLVIFVAFVR